MVGNKEIEIPESLITINFERYRPEGDPSTFVLELYNRANRLVEDYGVDMTEIITVGTQDKISHFKITPPIKIDQSSTFVGLIKSETKKGDSKISVYLESEDPVEKLLSPRDLIENARTYFSSQGDIDFSHIRANAEFQNILTFFEESLSPKN